jgi:hypothetical protein
LSLTNRLRLCQALAIAAFILVVLLSPLVTHGGTKLKGDSKQGPITITPRSGYAVRYSPGVMERVAVRRGLPVLPRMASVPDCGRLGWWVTATVNGYTGRYLVVDCSAPRDRARHIRQGLVLEVNHGSAVAYFPRGEGHTKASVLYYTRSPYKPRRVE